YYLFFLLIFPPPPTSTLFPYTTLFRSRAEHRRGDLPRRAHQAARRAQLDDHRRRLGPLRLGNRIADELRRHRMDDRIDPGEHHRSEEHTSELQSRSDLVCRLLLEKKKK